MSNSENSTDIFKLLAAAYPVFFTNERNSAIPFILDILNDEELSSDSDEETDEGEEIIIPSKKVKTEYVSDGDNDTASAPEAVIRNVASGIKEARNYVDLIATYPDVDFVQHFRLQKSTVDFILDNIREKTKPTGRPRMPFEKQVLMTLWYLGNREPLRAIAERFDTAISTLRDCVYRVCQCLADHRHKFIMWPTEQKCYESMEAFERLTGFPGVIGCIDSTHISIHAVHSTNRQNYVNKKNPQTIILQAVCDEARMFIDVECGWPGHLSDAEAFSNSHVFRTMSEDDGTAFPPNSHIVGDVDYPLSEQLMTPFPDDENLTQEQQQFNIIHSAVQIHAQEAIAILKGRCRMLQCVHIINTAMIPLLVLACCIIHNIAAQFNDNDAIEDVEIDVASEDRSKTLIMKTENGGEAKRNEICRQLALLEL